MVRKDSELQQNFRTQVASPEVLLKIGRECAALPLLDRRSPEQMLCDDRGLPK